MRGIKEPPRKEVNTLNTSFARAEKRWDSQDRSWDLIGHHVYQSARNMDIKPHTGNGKASESCLKNKYTIANKKQQVIFIWPKLSAIWS